jgi:hypothetical protein
MRTHRKHSTLQALASTKPSTIRYPGGCENPGFTTFVTHQTFVSDILRRPLVGALHFNSPLSVDEVLSQIERVRSLLEAEPGRAARREKAGRE